MYEIGRIYIWQNQTGEFAYLNGLETTVTGPLVVYVGYIGARILVGQATDTPPLPGEAYVTMASPGDLRLKSFPQGERQIMGMFAVYKNDVELVPS